MNLEKAKARTKKIIILMWLPSTIALISLILMSIFPVLRNVIFLINVLLTIASFFFLSLAVDPTSKYRYDTRCNFLVTFVISILFIIFLGYGMLGNNISVKKEYVKLQNEDYRYFKLKNSVKLFIDDKEYTSQKVSIYNNIDNIKKEKICLVNNYDSYGNKIYTDLLIDGEKI